jgi:hypothetical protein
MHRQGAQNLGELLVPLIAAGAAAELKPERGGMAGDDLGNADGLAVVLLGEKVKVALLTNPWVS